MVDSRTRYVLHPQAAHRSVGGEVYIVTEDRAFHRLSTATAIDLFMALASGPSTRDDLVTLLCQRFQVSHDRAQQDVDTFLQTLVDRHVAQCVTPPPA